MLGAWQVAEVRAAEQQVMAGLPDGALMARAAFGLATEARAMLGFSYGARVVLLVGSGDNGADALFAGALLAGRGMSVLAVAAGRADDAASAAFIRAGGRFTDLADVGPVDLIMDGLVGIGAHGPLRAPMLPLVEWASSSGAPVLAVDLPSGIDPSTGVAEGPAIRAAVTLCMGVRKPGLLVGDGRLHAGRVRVLDIGLLPVLASPVIWQLTDADVAAALEKPGPDDDKYTRGVVGVAAGSQRYPGAAQLCVGSARLGGVGAVRYAGHAAAEVVRRWPEVLVTDTVAEAGRVQAWAVGPGLGEDLDSLRDVLASDAPAIVDADGLNLLVDHRDWVDGRSAPTVLTPHDREFERLFGEVGPDRIAAARRAATAAGAVVLLKGFATVVAHPDGRVYLNPTGVPALGTAGSGDVLSGLIGSLLATGIEAALAAAIGAYLHGAAAERAAQDGPMVASDLHAALRAEIADLT